MKGWKILAWTGVAVIAVGTALWVKNQLSLLMAMSYKFKDFRLGAAENAGNVKLNFNLELKNPSKITITAHDYNIKVFVNQTVHVATISNTQGWSAEIPAGSSSLIPMSVEFSPKDLGQNIIHLAVNSLLTAKMAVTVKGSITMAVGKVGGINIRKTLPVDYTQNVIGQNG